ncbi:MAG: nucleotidyltransferase substrate binding protein [Planctomycetes bacterium]|nr:nucleotidyltransferase substrate binding protein [Planctomycetota bacterium]
MIYEERIKSFKKTIDNLTSVLSKPKNDESRDLAIKRFELCFEICWKTVRDFLKHKGAIYNSPRDTLKGIFKYGLIEDNSSWYDMIDDRNLAVHIYNEKLAEKIYVNLPNYLKLLNKLYTSLPQTLK